MRKIFCNVLDGITFEDRCLFKMSKVIEGNKVCEDCILRELERIKRDGIKATESKPSKEVKVLRRKKRGKKPGSVEASQRGTNRTRGVRQTCPNDTKDINVTNVTKDTNDLKEHDVRSLSKLLGKSIRRTQELAKNGKIPAHRTGVHWVFDKEEIEQWLAKRKSETGEVWRGARRKEPRTSPGQDLDGCEVAGENVESEKSSGSN